MLEALLSLIILFFVIFDPLASFAVFVVASSNMDKLERRRTAVAAILTASLISMAVLVFGESVLTLFSTNMEEFRVAGGIILGILGVKMAMGIPLMNLDQFKKDSGRAIAALIATPLITGPAAIMTIIVSVHDFGIIPTGLAIMIVLSTTTILFLQSVRIKKIINPTSIQIISTILGLVTLSWGIKFIITGILALI